MHVASVTRRRCPAGLEAAVVWVVPANSQALVSPAFANAPSVAVIGEHRAVADGIRDLLSAAGAYAQA
jgi:hypothetical protein